MDQIPVFDSVPADQIIHGHAVPAADLDMVCPKPASVLDMGGALAYSNCYSSHSYYIQGESFNEKS
jgi:hypothetical protein